MIDYIETHEMFKPLKAALGNGQLMHIYETVERDKGKALFAQRMMECWPEKLVYVVANPSSAVICAHKALVVLPRSEVWIATGSDTLTLDHLLPLWERDVVFFPTAQQYDQWRDAMPYMDEHPGKWIVDHTLSLFAIFYPPAACWDIATMAMMPNKYRLAFFNAIFGDIQPLLDAFGCLPKLEDYKRRAYGTL